MAIIRYIPKWIVLVALLPCAVAAWGGQLSDHTFQGAGYPYSDQRVYYVYTPDAYDQNQPAAMVMVLHGCHQTRDTIFEEFGWDDVADQHGFIVVAPYISTSDPGRFAQCWGYWLDQEIHQGAGEVEDLHHIAMEVERTWRIDPTRRYITGLSSGGFMANAAAVAHNEYWASAGVHSGGGYMESAGTYSFMCASPREASGTFRPPAALFADMQTEMDDGYAIPMMLIHSRNDCTVGYGVEGSGKYGGLTANRDAWLQINGGTQSSTEDCARDGIACNWIKYGPSRRSTVEVVSLTGLITGTDQNKGHYWSGGKVDGQWTKARGPKAAELFWDFFQRHPRDDGSSEPPPTPSPCQSFSGTIAAHEAANRAYARDERTGGGCSFWTVTTERVYYAMGSDENLGTDATRQVTLYTTEEGVYSTTPCDGD